MASAMRSCLMRRSAFTSTVCWPSHSSNLRVALTIFTGLARNDRASLRECQSEFPEKSAQELIRVKSRVHFGKLFQFFRQVFQGMDRIGRTYWNAGATID